MTTATPPHAWLRRLSDYHSGSGSPTERAAVETHLATCATCQEALAMYRRFYTLAASPLRLGAPRLTNDDSPTLPLAPGGADSSTRSTPLSPHSSMPNSLPSSQPPSSLPPSRPPRGRRSAVIGTLAAVLAVALLTASFVALLLPRLRPPVAPSATPTTQPFQTVPPFETPNTTPTSRPTTPPLTTPSVAPPPAMYTGPIPSDPRTVCTASGGAPLSVTQMAPGSSYYGGAGGYSGGQRLPDDLAQKPQQITTAIANAPALNPTSTTAFIPTFSAPPAGQTSTICGVTVTILAYQPIVAPVPNFTIPCDDDYYAVPGGFQGTGDCGATPAPHGEGSVSFTSTTVGTTATSSMIDVHLGAPPQPPQEPSPASEQTDAYVLLVHVSQPGAYTFGFSFWQSSAGPTVASPNSGDTLAAGQVLHEWGGPQCLTPAMQSQLPPAPPAGQPPIKVICPGPPQLPPGE